MDIDKGKALFFSCFGNYKTIEQDFGDEYRACEIPKETEAEWQKEINFQIIDNILKLKGEQKVTAVFVYNRVSDEITRLATLFAVLDDSLDTFSRMLLCEALFYEKSRASSDELYEKISEKLTQNVDKMLSEPISIDSDFTSSPQMRGYDFSDANLKTRIKLLLE